MLFSTSNTPRASSRLRGCPRKRGIFTTRDLLRRIRSTRRQAAQPDRTLAIAERIAVDLDRDWTKHATDRERLKRLALRYFKLLDRTRAVIVEAGLVALNARARPVRVMAQRADP